VPSLQNYMSQYDHEHTNRWNKLLHGIGIPIIFVGIILAIFTLWRIGLAFFVDHAVRGPFHRGQQTRILSRIELFSGGAGLDRQGN